MEICECGHPLESHAVHAPHYCHEDCQCDAYVQATKDANLGLLKDAVVAAAVTKVLAVRVWKASGGWNAPREVLRQVDTADEEIIRAVDAYLAALEG
jgi:hypothetical protein